MTVSKIAVIESPNPIDAFAGRSEAESLVPACKLIGHAAISFLVKSEREFNEVFNYLSSASSSHDEPNSSGVLFVHISCHGNSNGIAAGRDSIPWERLVELIQPVFLNKKYNGKVAIVLSSCGSGENDLHEYITSIKTNKISSKIPNYIFSIPGETVNWDDALVGWILFYHKISCIDIEKKSEVQSVLKSIFSGVGQKFSYHRWDDEKNTYLTYTPKG